MAEPACTADASDRQEGADRGYFAALESARYLRITTFNRHGIPVSASVPGVVDGDRAYFCSRSRSGTVKRLRHAGAVQATPCGVLGFCIYGVPLDAIARRLSGDEAALAAAKLRRGFPIRLPRRRAVYYELLPGAAAVDQDEHAGSSASVTIRVYTRREPACSDATTPTSLATVCTPSATSRPLPARPRRSSPRIGSLE